MHFSHLHRSNERYLIVTVLPETASGPEPSSSCLMVTISSAGGAYSSPGILKDLAASTL